MNRHSARPARIFPDSTELRRVNDVSNARLSADNPNGRTLCSSAAVDAANIGAGKES
jgi:hypothetical protein